MDIIQIVIVAIVQGLTEFLPVSSSAHLILVPVLFDWPDQGLVFDVAVHLGSLIAVVVYFRIEVRDMLIAWLSSVSGKGHSENSKLAWWVIIGTIPAVLAGLIFKDVIEIHLRSGLVIAATTILFGLLLWWSDHKQTSTRNEYQLTLKDVIIIGCAQAIALIPGTSRSGITMTAALFLGLGRQAAAKFSFLLSMPIIVAGSVLQVYDLVTSDAQVIWGELILAIILSAISAGICIHLFLKLIDKVGMLPFVIYRLVLGVFLLFVLL